jgi:hypothetical protein
MSASTFAADSGSTVADAGALRGLGLALALKDPFALLAGGCCAGGVHAHSGAKTKTKTVEMSNRERAVWFTSSSRGDAC